MIPSPPNPIGVVNITPDSFSDGGKFNQRETFAARMQELLSWKIPIVDIGAESTAPFNGPITQQEEQSRFAEIFFPWKSKSNPMVVFSIDTYRPSTFVFVDDFLQLNAGKKTIWNDVSGVIDEDVFHILKERKHCYYVYCHTTTQKRENSSHHMEYPLSCNPEDTVKKVREDFLSTIAIFKNKGLEDRLILDPGLGLSKTFEQNWELIKNLCPLIQDFSAKIPWVVGISRKSFLKKMTFKGDKEKTLAQTEYLQSCLIYSWIKKLKNRPIFFRLHDPGVFAMANALEKKNVS